ncbi:TetR/AcrR family transcriptional regulator [Aquincola sp. J276]|uniref:TetR/AcrR family transcriptional regulator n=1 Tax=Aquincola sp. J276 TaxID=2898432 RepID=UPI002150B220|nr:TetR/AcrR family transcriptional regulator [Aquincola sp. J276]MCR5868510.1 TetR/AcrR family transcriptional regulator [Aquincola sp. J276]
MRLIPFGIVTIIPIGIARQRMNPDLHDLPPRERVIAAAARLFYEEGIRGVGVERIAAEAATTKMSLYRHFHSKDELVVHWLGEVARAYDGSWRALEATHGETAAKLLGGLVAQVAAGLSDPDHRGCPLSNSLVELPDPGHPGRDVITAYKAKQIERLQRLCAGLGVLDAPAKGLLLHALFEGVQTVAQTMDRQALAASLPAFVNAILGKRAV